MENYAVNVVSDARIHLIGNISLFILLLLIFFFLNEKMEEQNTYSNNTREYLVNLYSNFRITSFVE